MSREIIFIHVPKTGGITLRRELPWLVTPTDWGHCTAEQIRRQIGPALFAAAYKVAFIRNPLARMVSLYHHFKQLPLIHEWYEPNRWLADKIRSYPDFETFVRNYKSDGLQVYYHLYPQMDYLTVAGEVAVDFIGRTETLQADAVLLGQHLGQSVGQLPELNRSVHAPWEQYYTPETAAIITDDYAEGFKFWSSQS